ncbi:hypothetical protein [uncultured Brevundimonas sp.]|uniref:hypothetical protein n=1 Tax=uncultured Brevundimonas sp. TaxID=213418 RepID=UPI0030EDC55F|tara:strand:- start:51811 stop:51996 length:186 start_codon:yes stop_codon:yes gene_type:complete
MQFSSARFLFFLVAGLPVGFILVALGFAVAGLPISAPQLFPWALGLAVIAGAIAGFWRRSA